MCVDNHLVLSLWEKTDRKLYSETAAITFPTSVIWKFVSDAIRIFCSCFRGAQNTPTNVNITDNANWIWTLASDYVFMTGILQAGSMYGTCIMSWLGWGSEFSFKFKYRQTFTLPTPFGLCLHAELSFEKVIPSKIRACRTLKQMVQKTT